MTDSANTLPDTITTRDGTVHQVSGLPDPIKALIARAVQWDQKLTNLKTEHGEVVAKLQAILEQADLLSAALNTCHMALEQNITAYQANKTIQFVQNDAAETYVPGETVLEYSSNVAAFNQAKAAIEAYNAKVDPNAEYSYISKPDIGDITSFDIPVPGAAI